MLMRMEPMQQQPVQPNPYEFITNPGQQKPVGGGSTKSRIIVVAVGIVLLLVIGLGVSTLLSSAGKAAEQSLKDIVAEQEEIIRISETGAKDALSVETRSFAMTVLASVQTDQQKISKLVKLKPEERRAKQSSKTDEALTAAKANNRYDEVLTETLITRIGSYRTALKTAYDSTKAGKTRTTLSDTFDSASALLPRESAQ